MSTEESRLLARVGRQDRDAFHALVRQLAPAALALARRVTGIHDLAEEAVQEAFCDVWLKAGRYDSRRGGARQWLLTLVHHKAVDLVRRERVAGRVADAPPMPSTAGDPEEMAWVSDRRRRVAAAMDNLPAAQRDAITLAYFDGLTYREVARRLGIPEGTAKSRMRDGLMTLRGLLERHGVELRSTIQPPSATRSRRSK